MQIREYRDMTQQMSPPQKNTSRGRSRKKKEKLNSVRKEVKINPLQNLRCPRITAQSDEDGEKKNPLNYKNYWMNFQKPESQAENWWDFKNIAFWKAKKKNTMNFYVYLHIIGKILVFLENWKLFFWIKIGQEIIQT